MPKYDIEVELVGQDGNALNLIGLVRRAIAKNVGDDESRDFVTAAMKQPSYEALLVFINETVNVS